MKKKSEDKYWTPKRRDEFVNKLKELAGTQAEIAKLLDTNDTTISRWRTGEGYPSIEQLLTIADHYHCTVDYLLGNDSSDTPEIETLADIAKCLFRLDNEHISVSTSTDEDDTTFMNYGLLKFYNEKIISFFEQWKDILKIRNTHGGEETYSYWKEIKLEQLKELRKDYGYDTEVNYFHEVREKLNDEYCEFLANYAGGYEIYTTTVSKKDFDLVDDMCFLDPDLVEWYSKCKVVQ